jgi:hypothetical protein
VLVSETVRMLGADPLIGLKLHSIFLAAGLPAPSLRLESVIAGGGTSADHVRYEMDLVTTVLPEMERLGIAKPEDFDIETFADRVFEEVAASESVVVGRAEIGAWSRTPGP